MENKISAFIVAYHEEKVIERCLKSLIGVVDEILVIHDGPCQDQTLNIARKYTKKIIETKINKGIGESHYIQAVNECTYPWVLRIDADEYLDKDLKLNIKSLTTNNDIASYAFVWPIWNGKKYISKGWPHKNFLFQKEMIGIIDLFHHPIVIYGKSKKSEYIVHHKPNYNNYTKEIFNKKTIRWCKLQAKDHLSNLEDKERYNVNLKNFHQERRKKDRYYHFPKLCFIAGFLNTILDLFRNPSIVFQEGFWRVALISGAYSYQVAIEVQRLKKEKKATLSTNSPYIDGKRKT